MNERVALIAWVTSAFLFGTAAHAQTVDEHLREGFALRQRGAEADALARFEAAWALSPEPRVAAQLGLTHQALGHWIDAERFLQRALDAPGDPWVQHNRAPLESALSVVRQRLGEVVLVGSPAGADVLVDGRAVGRLPLAAPLRVLAGVIRLEVRAEGYVPVQRRVVVDPGAALREEVELAPAPAPPLVTPRPPAPPVVSVAVPTTPPSVAASRPASSTLRVMGITLLATGGAAVAFGAAAAVAREDATVTYNGRCPSPRPNLSAECQSLLDAESAWGVARWVGLATGGALLVVGAAALVLQARPERRVTWACGPGWLSLGCALRF